MCIQVEERLTETLNANLFSHACQNGVVHMISAITFKEAPDGDTDYFDIVAGVLQGDTQAPYLLSSA